LFVCNFEGTFPVSWDRCAQKTTTTKIKHSTKVIGGTGMGNVPGQCKSDGMVPPQYFLL